MPEEPWAASEHGEAPLLGPPTRRSGWHEYRDVRSLHVYPSMHEYPKRAARPQGAGHPFPLFDQRVRTQSPPRPTSRSPRLHDARTTVLPDVGVPAVSIVPVFFNSIQRGSIYEIVDMGTARTRYGNSAYITASKHAMSEYDAARIFLEKPADPESEHGWRLAEALGHDHNIPPCQVSEIWATKSFMPGQRNGHKLSQWQTDAFPPFFPDPDYPDPEPRRRPPPGPAL